VYEEESVDEDALDAGLGTGLDAVKDPLVLRDIGGIAIEDSESEVLSHASSSPQSGVECDKKCDCFIPICGRVGGGLAAIVI
jgi:hypothetical protein